MLNTNKLKSYIVGQGMTQGDVAKSLNISPKTFSNKMKKGVFGSDEIEIMIKLLNIKDPMSVFFAQQVT